MSTAHIILQGKGGVGKSLVASLIAQFCTDHDRTPLCIDTDPVNHSFAAYKDLNVIKLDILEDNDVDQSKFDQLIELINDHPEQNAVIDNGASCFVPLSNYLLENETIEMLTELGHEIIIHTVVTGGQSMMDTLHGLNNVLTRYPSQCKFIVWCNPYWGEISHDGKPFEKLKAYTENKDKISAVIYLPSMQKDTFQRDFINMLRSKKTFRESINDMDLSLMNRQRLTILKRKIFAAIDATNII